MMAMAADLNLDAKIEGGLMKGLKRSVLGGESLFMTTATAAPQAAGSILPSLPGDVTVFDVTPEMPLLIQKGSFCAPRWVWRSTPSGVGCATSSVARAGLCVRAARGRSCCRVTASRPLRVAARPAGGRRHEPMVAFAESVQMELTRASDSFMKSAKTGEGFVFVFTARAS